MEINDLNYDNVEKLEQHLLRYFAKDEITVFHELISLDFHLDVNFIQLANRSFNLLITSGMCSYPMKVSNHIENKHEYEFAELMILLPKSISYGEIYTGDEPNSWIISMLKQTARFPYHHDTFISLGHTLQADSDMKPYSKDTTFVGCILLPSMTFDDEFTKFYTGSNLINIYTLFPLYREELEFKIQYGLEAFFDLLSTANLKETFEPKRKSLVNGTK